MLKRVALFFFFPFVCLKGVLIEPIPNWVKPCEFLLDASVKPSQIHLQQLLSDRQHHWEKETIYLHHAVKVIDEIGAKDASKISLQYDPSYEMIVFHTLRLYRNGQWIDRLESSRCELFRQEDLLQTDLSTDQLTLVYILEDVRIGDVIEYALSLEGDHPAQRPYHEDFIYLQSYQSFEKIYHRILCSDRQPVFTKPFYSSQTPIIQEIDSTLLEWVWEVENTSAYEREPHQPAWYNPLERIQLTQYRNWKEVVLQFLSLYPDLADFKEIADEEMTTLVNKWQNLTPDKMEQALLALRFVQDLVHYLGFEEGIRSMKPSTPHLVFNQRYGDCKDKTVLLQALLHLMDISSHPVLVSSRHGKNAKEFLPTFGNLFDHVILRIQIGGSTYFVDPTLTFQGGSLSANICPDYGWGLVIAEETQDLIPIPPTHLQNPTTISTTIRLSSMDTAEVHTSFTYYGMRAEIRRKELKYLGEKKLFKEYFELTPKAISPLPISLSDNREQNVFTLSLSYQLPIKKRSSEKILPIHSHTLKGGLDKDLKPERKAPYALVYPLWVKEHIHVENPFNNWDVEANEVQEEHPSLVYKSAMKKGGQTADYDFEIRHLQDHVSAEGAPSYYDILQRIESPDPLEIELLKK